MTESTQRNRHVVIGLGPVPPEEVETVLGADVDFVAEPGPQDLAVVEGAIVRAAVTVGEAELERMPELKVIARTGVGVDDVDVPAARRRGIPVAITPGTNTNAVAEGAFAHILHLVKSLDPLTRLVREGRWTERSGVPVGDLEGATLGIMGYGRIGQRVAHIARAFGMEILAYDPVAPVDPEIRAETVEELLKGSDVVSLHLPLVEQTRNLLDRDALNIMRPGAVLINVSRGGIVDEDALLEALEEGRISGAGLDAFDPEPTQDHPLYHHPNTVLTPHVMGLSKNAASATFHDAAVAVRAVLDGGQPAAVA
ncbi:hydroxyacid dehydrogenase [Kocuria sp. TGY1127_2]|uniref:hydroxyacid dehydrogenase n=1 Tax=Kocuria sp. TGY1127_2 TaxID=2711328 RepID=UPI0015BF8519|nr:hydroxyacid dehydrogenase [Kocuria sp. TGY1127_2]